MNYTLKTAFQGLWNNRWMNILCTLTIATSLFLISIAGVGYLNIKKITSKLPDRFAITVFLNEDLEEDRIRVIMTQVKGIAAVKKLTYISREDGLKDLKRSLGDAAYILEGIEGNPLPAAFEIIATRSAVTSNGIKALAKNILAIEGVDDAYYPPKLLRVVSTASKYADTAGAAIIILLGIAGLFVSYSTIKILFYSKENEMHTLKLLGATKGFIRAPFIIEGAIIGGTAGLLSFAAFASIYAFVFLKLVKQYPLVKELYIPIQMLPAIPAIGLTVGVIGALIAIGRIRF
jgi:cell division transport system permease protein